jgi:hypothetical protein
MVGRTNREIVAIKTAFKNIYGEDLEKRIVSELKGHTEKYFVSLLQAARDEAGALKDVDGDVQALYKAGEGRMGTDETEFIRIFNTRSFPHLHAVFQAYAKKHERTMMKVIEKEFSGDLGAVLRYLVTYVEDPATYFANHLEDSMAGIGTNEEKLNRLVLRVRRIRYMPQVKEAYLKKFGKSLDKRVKGETSGDYEKLLVALIEVPL